MQITNVDTVTALVFRSSPTSRTSKNLAGCRYTLLMPDRQK
ncbi:hypothetical protein [Microcoleus sp. S13_C3]